MSRCHFGGLKLPHIVLGGLSFLSLPLSLYFCSASYLIAKIVLCRHVLFSNSIDFIGMLTVCIFDSISGKEVTGGVFSEFNQNNCVYVVLLVEGRTGFGMRHK